VSDGKHVFSAARKPATVKAEAAKRDWGSTFLCGLAPYMYLVVVITFSAALATASLASSPPPSQQPLIAPGEKECVDTPAPQLDKLSAETLPVHFVVAEYLRRSRLTDFGCKSKSFSYSGTRDGEAFRVISSHLTTGKPHLEVNYGSYYNLGGMRKHGVLTAYWPNGKLQFKEYMCFGFPVGFHQYFNEKGTLASVIDYTNSYYHWELAHDYRHRLVSDGGHSDSMDRRALLQEIFSVTGTRKNRQSLNGGGVFLRGYWESLDPASSVAQWTTSGKQGTVKWMSRGGRDAELINDHFDYTPFWESWLRDRRKNPGKTLPPNYASLILDCPWIDQAMQLALDDKRFALPALQTVTEADRQATPSARYMACLAQPNRDCLLDFALTLPKVNQLDVAKAAIVVGRPDVALKTVNDVLARTQNYELPSVVFATPTALKAKAAITTGNQDLATAAASDALAHASNRRGSSLALSIESATMEAGTALADAGYIEHARKLHALAEDAHMPRANQILLQIGLAEVRTGKLAQAAATERQLRQRGALPPLSEDQRKAGPIWHERERDYLDEEHRKAFVLASAQIADIRSPGQKPDPCLAERNELRKDQVETAIASEGSDSGRIPLSNLVADAALETERCGNRELAVERFRIAQRLTEKVQFCRLDVCSNYQYLAQQYVARQIIEAGALHLLENWVESAQRPADIQIPFALSQAKNGDNSGALSRLQAIEPGSLTELNQKYMATAEVMALQGSKTGMLAALNDAFRAAKFIDVTGERARQLLELAALQRRLKLCKQALQSLAAARNAVDLTRVDPDAPIYITNALVFLPGIASEYALCRADEQVDKTLDTMVRRPAGSAGGQHQAILDANRIVASIAVANAQQGRIELAIQQVEALPLSPWKLDAALAIQVASSRRSTTEQQVAAALISAQATQAAAYFLAVENSFERRLLVAGFSSLLRSNSKAIFVAPAFSEVVTQARLIDGSQWQARSLCELAYTAAELGRPDSVALAQSAVEQLHKRRPLRELMPDPHGACAWWLRRAGHETVAAQILDEPIAQLREKANATQGTSNRGHPHELINLAMMYSENESGELFVNWAKLKKP
jgi:hypothetical protein